MNTKTLEQFVTLTDTELSAVEGGKNKDGRDLACVLGTAGMAGAGFLFAGPGGAAVLGGATALRVCR
ncbi:Blp family class II bacteriocin [Streptococcus pantholopis]|uniref:Bacteriocin-type signal sequence n=1 Tax=Streptococcus pantholopis TaxID=1811193 RepID=A0A172Q637_9STRE|nr:Blp family class II bacteriocin [Streptococcus pantholopis]AND78908.1 bacteriocin-type signal sequence [Streptococcus pantholopis]